MYWLWLAIFLTLGSSASALVNEATLPLYDEVTGQEIRYLVRPGDTLGGIAQRYGMRVGLAATVNGLADPHRLHVGQQLLISNRRIVPAKAQTGIVIDIADRALYWFDAGRLRARFPVAVGRQDWETPPGKFTIVGRQRHPTWHVPPSIQAEMRSRGEPVRTVVPPGPDNPLGEYWLQLSAAGYGIHGTNAPRSIGSYGTHGCLRLQPEHVERLYNEVLDGTPVLAIYEPIKLAELSDSRVLLEAHPDVYKRAQSLITGFAESVHEAGLANRVDIEKALAVIRDAWGIPVDVTKDSTVAIGW